MARRLTTRTLKGTGHPTPPLDANFILKGQVLNNTIITIDNVGDLMDTGKTKWIWRVLGGLVLMILGLVIIFYPGISLLLFVEIFGAFLVIAGIFEIAFGVSGPKSGVMKGSFVIQGVFSVIIGILAIVLPGMTLLMATYLVAAWAFIWGITEIVAVLTASEDMESSVYGTNVKMGKGMGVLIGIIAIVLGLMTLAWPGVTLALVTLLVGWMVLMMGILIAIGGYEIKGPLWIRPT